LARTIWRDSTRRPHEVTSWREQLGAGKVSAQHELGAHKVETHLGAKKKKKSSAQKKLPLKQIY
jgi:hypothetical protein